METVPQTHGASDLPASNKPSRAEFTYDAAGRTTGVATSAGTTSLTWDYEDRLVGITYPSTATNSFSYNAFGARVSKTDSSGTATYARNGVSVVAPVLSDGSLTFTPGISSRDGSNSTHAHGDIKNSLRQTAANESTSATKHFDAFGNETSSTGTWQGPFQYGGPFGYQTDPDSNLKLLGHRYYDSSTGRFLTRDAAAAGENWYCYCNNNPASLADPLGDKGHHIVPVAVFGRVPGLSAAAKAVFDAATLPAGQHGWSKEHVQYNRAVKELFDAYFSGVHPPQITKPQAEGFVDLVKRSKDPRIKTLLENCAKAEALKAAGRKGLGAIVGRVLVVSFVVSNAKALIEGGFDQLFKELALYDIFDPRFRKSRQRFNGWIDSRRDQAKAAYLSRAGLSREEWEEWGL